MDGCRWFVHRGFLANRFATTLSHPCGASRLAAVSLVQPNRGLRGGQHDAASIIGAGRLITGMRCSCRRHHSPFAHRRFQPHRVAAAARASLLSHPGHAATRRPERGWVDFDLDRVDLQLAGLHEERPIRLPAFDDDRWSSPTPNAPPFPIPSSLRPSAGRPKEHLCEVHKRRRRRRKRRPAFQSQGTCGVLLLSSISQPPW